MIKIMKDINTRINNKVIIRVIIGILIVSAFIIKDYIDTSIKKQITYNTVYDAMLNSDINLRFDEEFRRNIDEVIFNLESSNYITVFYKSKDKNKEAVSLAKFKILYENDCKKYKLEVFKRGPLDNSNIEYFNGLDGVKKDIQFNLSQIMGPDKNKNFIYGINSNENIQYLKIENQKPDNIIPFKLSNHTFYFWYYEDLKTNKNNHKDYTISMNKT